jgi:hypothetical protein
MAEGLRDAGKLNNKSGPGAGEVQRGALRYDAVIARSHISQMAGYRVRRR